MKRVDRDAMRRAIEEVRSWVGPDAEQLLQKLAAEPREDVGRFASYSAQDVHLQLRPWQTPPSWLCNDRDVEDALSMPDDHTGRRAAGEIVKRLLAAGLAVMSPTRALAGLSKFHPERGGMAPGSFATSGWTS